MTQIPTPSELETQRYLKLHDIVDQQIKCIIESMHDGRPCCTVVTGGWPARALVIEEMRKRGWVCTYDQSDRTIKWHAAP